MRIFNVAEELEKERKKNKELEKQLNCKKEFTKYLPKDTEFIILTKQDYDRQQQELQDKLYKIRETITLRNQEMTKLLYIELLEILKGSDNNE